MWNLVLQVLVQKTVEWVSKAVSEHQNFGILWRSSHTRKSIFLESLESYKIHLSPPSYLKDTDDSLKPHASTPGRAGGAQEPSSSAPGEPAGGLAPFELVLRAKRWYFIKLIPNALNLIPTPQNTIYTSLYEP